MNEWISSEVGLPTSLMASWTKPSGGGGGGGAIRRPGPPPNNPNGSGPPQAHRAFRRPAPYPKPQPQEERDNTQESYEEVDPQQHDYSGNMQYEGYQHQQNEVDRKSLSQSLTQRVSLYQKFYRQVQEQRKPADCVVLSVSSGSTDYPKSLGLCLQERGLSVEMLYLQAESGLTRALQDVRADGSPFCILVEQANVSLSSCTVIIFSESLKIHRNMPKDQAMEFVAAEYGHGGVKANAPSDPADIAARSSELVDDFLEREKIERHVVPSETRQLLLLLAEGVHMYPEELGTIAEYLRSRQDHAQASSAEGSRGNMLPPGLGKPPPLLPTPPGPPPGLPSGGGGSGGLLAEALADHSPSQPTPLLGSSGSYPKTKPPPLLSLHRPPGPPHGPPGPQLGGPPAPRGPPSSHNPYGAPPGPRGPPSHHAPPYHLGPRGARGPPPSLRSLRPQAPLLANPGGPPPRPSGPRR